MVKKLLLVLLCAYTCACFAVPQTVESFSKVKILDNAALEKAIYTNKNKEHSAFHNIKVLYTISTSSIKVSEEDASKLVNEIKKLKGVIDCFFDSHKFLLLVKTEKEVNYVRIEQIKEVLKNYSSIQIEDYSEVLYSVD